MYEKSELPFKPGKKYSLKSVTADSRRFVIEFGEYGTLDVTLPVGAEFFITAGDKPFVLTVPGTDADNSIHLVDG